MSNTKKIKKDLVNKRLIYGLLPGLRSSVFYRNCFSPNLVLAEQTAWKLLVDGSKWGSFKSQKIPLPLMIC